MNHSVQPRLDRRRIRTAERGGILERPRWQRVKFEKGTITLANSWTKPLFRPPHGWNPPHSEWKTSDPSGDYQVAWDHGGSGLWYVDSTGIQHLKLGWNHDATLIDGGHWPMSEAGAKLAEMPDGVRKALKLPRR